MDVGEDGVRLCQHWIDAEKRECGRWLYLYNVRGGRTFIVELENYQEWIRAVKLLASPAERLDYFGIFTALLR